MFVVNFVWIRVIDYYNYYQLTAIFWGKNKYI